MRTSTKIAEPYVMQEPFHFLKEHDRSSINETRNIWGDTVHDPVKGILFGILMGGLLWVVILLLVFF